AHTHEDYIGKRAVIMLHSLLLGQGHFIHYFIKVHVALARQETSSTKLARQRAAHLRRYAYGHPLISRYQHALYKMAIVQLQAVFDGAVAAELAMVNFYFRDEIFRCQLLPELLRQVGHIVNAAGKFGPNPVVYLPGTKLWLTQLREYGLYFFQAQMPQIFHPAKVHSLYLSIFFINVKIYTKQRMSLQSAIWLYILLHFL